LKELKSEKIIDELHLPLKAELRVGVGCVKLIIQLKLSADRAAGCLAELGKKRKYK